MNPFHLLTSLYILCTYLFIVYLAWPEYEFHESGDIVCSIHYYHPKTEWCLVERSAYWQFNDWISIIPIL